MKLDVRLARPTVLHPNAIGLLVKSSYIGL